MIKNYLKIAWRNFIKYRTISAINLLGLTIGLTSCLLITIYILNELSYDKYNKHADNIYRVTRSFNNEDGVVSLTFGTIAPAFGYYMPSAFPDIQKMTRLLDNGITPFRYKEKLFNEKEVFFADENLVDVFTINVLKGNAQKALAEPNCVMLTEEAANKYFGDEDPMNKVLLFNNKINLKVTGVYKAFPHNAHLHPKVLISFNSLMNTALMGEEELRTSFGSNSFFTYLLLPQHYDSKKMVARFPDFVDKIMNKEYGGKQPSTLTKLGLQKLTDIHLYSHTDFEVEANGDISRVYIFSAIALFILLIACINYMNLSTARSVLRAKEIGLRKAIGANSKEILFQFISESVLITWLATFITLGCLYFALPWFNKISGQQLSPDILMKWQVLVPLLLSPFIIGIIAGIYPALFMSAMEPVKTLKGLFKAEGKSISFRKVLVVAQFAISIILIITTAIVYQQLHYVQQRSLGFNKEHVVVIPYNNALTEKFESFRSDLLSSADFKEATRTSRIPTGRLLDYTVAATLSGDSTIPSVTAIKYVSVDYNFVPTYGITMAAGRNFSKDYGTDTSNYILNETAVKALGWNTINAVGKNFKYGTVSGHVIGVMKDFHFESMHQLIAPMVLVMYPPAYFNNLSVKFSGSNTTKSLAYLESTWKKFIPDIPFEYHFLDENFDRLYESEQRQGTLYTTFACIAIFIASLGLLGLSAFTISQRIKEIGVRKVLGADTSGIVVLLSKEFLILVAIAALIAFPVAWYSMHNWLKDFAYRVNIQWWVFLVAAIVALFVVLVTVSFQAIKAAVANPVKSLKVD